MNRDDIIQKTINFVKQKLNNAEGGHDWWHIYRVWKNAKMIAEHEEADQLTIELAALLHDIADAKFNNGDEEIGPATAGAFLSSLGLPAELISHVQDIIRYMSFKASMNGNTFNSIELQVVQDADRLDAIGAIGIARAFSFGGFKGREIYNPEIKPNLNMSKAEYKKAAGPTINHFYEKLFLLKDRMNTATGKRLAAQRHQFMELYINQFYFEVE